MASQPEVIRKQMEETREHLTDKLEILEQQVVGTVQDARSAVSETVDTVKEAVQDSVETVKETVRETVENVKDTFSLSSQMERRPWTMFAGAVATGYLCGHYLLRAGSEHDHNGTGMISSLLSGSDGNARDNSTRPSNFLEGSNRAFDSGFSSSQPAENKPSRGFFSQELNSIKEMAIGALLGVVRDIVAKKVPPSMERKIATFMDDLTTKLGGQPIPEPILGGMNKTAHHGYNNYEAPQEA